MFKTNILLAYRSLMKEKGFTLINTIGLALGLACFILIMVYVIHEHSYEKFRPGHERMYRVYLHGNFNSNSEQTNDPFMPYVMSQYLLQTYPEVEQTTCVGQVGGGILSYKETGFQEWRALVADTSFLDLFPVEFIAGNAKTALAGKHKVVMTETLAKKLFGSIDPIGKLVTFQYDTIPFEVTGVVRDPRTDTHMKFSMLLSMQTYLDDTRDKWIDSRRASGFTYVKLKENSSAQQFEAKIQTIITEKFSPAFQAVIGKGVKEIVGGGAMPSLRVQKVDDSHLDPILSLEIGGVAGANATMLNITMAIAFAILLLACINFVNLSTARFSNRMKEICVKKTCGSSRWSLFVQFIAESYLLTLISIFIALAIVELTIKPFCDSMVLEYVIAFYEVNNFFPFIITVFILVGFLAGAYPALVMSSVGITDGFRGKQSMGKRGAYLRKSLVVLQFSISFIILLGALVINNQLDYIMADNKGYTRENLVILHNVRDIKRENLLSFKQEVLKVPGVQMASYSLMKPDVWVPRQSFILGDDVEKKSMEFVLNVCDWDYLQTLKLTLARGRYYDKTRGNDTMSIIVNEAAERAMGVENAVGKRLAVHTGRPESPYAYYTIIGIVKDFNAEPIHKPISPMLIYVDVYGFDILNVKIDPAKTTEAIVQIKKLWRQFTNGKNLHHEDMQDALDWQYRNEISAQKLISTFSFICIVIACLGLIGLVSYSTLRRTKEIGIRKANGATVWQIVFTLSKDTMVLVAIGIAIALPVGYLVINGWLSQFAYHVDMSVWVFALAIVVLYAIALLSEASITIRAARQNPVKALRYE